MDVFVSIIDCTANGGITCLSITLLMEVERRQLKVHHCANINIVKKSVITINFGLKQMLLKLRALVWVCLQVFGVCFWFNLCSWCNPALSSDVCAVMMRTVH